MTAEASSDRNESGSLADEERSRLDELDAHIEQVEEEVEEHEGGGSGPKFYESGTIRPEDDDQTIAPPG
jgi:hypothetical protein